MIDIPILIYHYFGADRTGQIGIKADDLKYITLLVTFQNHILFLLEKGYEAISFVRLLHAKNGRKELPPKPIILTFDDGHTSVFDHAFPVMWKYNWPGEAFVITGRVGSPGYMDWNQLKELSDNGISIQSHTHTHSLLNSLSSQDISRELIMSKTAIEDKLGNDVTALAVSMGGYPKSLKALARDLGYDIVCTSYYGINNLESDFFHLKRIMIKSPGDKVVDLLNLLKRNSYLAFKMRMKNWGKYLRNKTLCVLL